MTLKNVLPFENYILTTKLPVNEVIRRLTENIQAKPGFNLASFSRRYSKPYSGQINGTVFTMSRNIDYRNSFLPVIKGHVSTFLGETQVSIKMQPETFVLIFISLWLGILGIVCITMLLIGFLNLKQIIQNGFSPMLFIPFIMFVFGCLLTHFAFKKESKNSKEFLARLLESIDK